jgi:protein phosphatase
MITAAGGTHPGPVRPINEDAFHCDTETGLFIVADGMGGHHAGEVASALAIETIRTFLARTSDGENVTWPYGIDPKLSFESNRLLTALKLANRRVFKSGEDREEYTGMGTTVVAAMLADERLIFGGVGDSRLYLLSAGTLTQLTEDDTWIRLTGTVDPKVITSHSMKHVLTNVIGARDSIDCNVSEKELNSGATLLLSSDGLHGSIDAARIQTLLDSSDPPSVIAERLVQAALKGGSTDNVTAVVVRYQP